YVRSHCTFDDGSSLNDRNASMVFKPRERAKQWTVHRFLGDLNRPTRASAPIELRKMAQKRRPPFAQATAVLARAPSL
ncbi:hypothetical protein PENNAL_c0736G07739, partial [Penicillium nalgiovense]